MGVNQGVSPAVVASEEDLLEPLHTRQIPNAATEQTDTNRHVFT